MPLPLSPSSGNQTGSPHPRRWSGVSAPLKAAGVKVEYRKNLGVGSGFGLDTGTRARMAQRRNLLLGECG